jgi:calcineurin-like phosphoesterase family protein
MRNNFYIADPHFSHNGVCIFTRQDGSQLRPWDNTNDMDEALISNWNSVVKSGDTTYVLGDVVMRSSKLHILGRLNGRKVLIKGNHDLCDLSQYRQWFADVRAYQVDKELGICSHVPIHSDCIERYGHNVHGHLHANRIMIDNKPDSRYTCVSVEQINYTPIEKGELMQLIKSKQPF